MKNRHFYTTLDYSVAEVRKMIDLAIALKYSRSRKTGDAKEGSHTEMYRSMGYLSGRTRVRLA